MKMTVQCQQCGAEQSNMVGRSESMTDAVRWFVKFRNWQYIETLQDKSLLQLAYWRCPEHHLKSYAEEETRA